MNVWCPRPVGVIFGVIVVMESVLCSGRSLPSHFGSCNWTEFDVLGHFDRDASGECTDLFMNVHEKGVRPPASLFTDFEVGAAIEVHCHGTTSSEGVATDVVFSLS